MIDPKEINDAVTSVEHQCQIKFNTWIAEIRLKRQAVSDQLNEEVGSSSENEGITTLLIPEEIDLVIYKHLQHFHDQTVKSGRMLDYIRNIPFQLLTNVCLLALEEAKRGNVDLSIDLLSKSKVAITCFNVDIDQFYKTTWFNHVIGRTLMEIQKKYRPEMDFQGGSECSVMSDEEHEFVETAVKLQTLSFYRESVEELGPLASKLSHLKIQTPDTCSMRLMVLIRKRKESNAFLVSPTKKEFNAVKKGLAIQPANAQLRLAAISILYDSLRSPDRDPGMKFLGVRLSTGEVVTALLHEELQLATEDDLPALFAAEVLTIACEFYNYRNLKNIMCRTRAFAAVDNSLLLMVPYMLNEDVLQASLEDISSAIDPNEYLAKALEANPLNSRLSVYNAELLLRSAGRELAIDAFRSMLDWDPLDADTLIFYIRLIIGGDQNMRSAALAIVNKALMVGTVIGWSPVLVVHLHFLKGMLEVVNDDLKSALHSWAVGYQIGPEAFRDQFQFWTKRQRNKYKWPDVFCDVKFIIRLQQTLVQILKLMEETGDSSERAEVQNGAEYACILSCLGERFPLAAEIQLKLSLLMKDWGYLLRKRDVEVYDSSDISSSEDEEEEQLCDEENKTDGVLNEQSPTNLFTSINDDTTSVVSGLLCALVQQVCNLETNLS